MKKKEARIFNFREDQGEMPRLQINTHVDRGSYIQPWYESHILDNRSGIEKRYLSLNPLFEVLASAPLLHYVMHGVTYSSK